MGEAFAADFGENSCADPDAGARLRGPALVKRVGLHEGFDVGRELVALRVQRQKLHSRFEQHDSGCVGAHDVLGLLACASNIA